jgi:hypothetical protein
VSPSAPPSLTTSAQSLFGDGVFGTLFTPLCNHEWIFFQGDSVSDTSEKLEIDFAQLSGLAMVRPKSPHRHDSSFEETLGVDLNRVSSTSNKEYRATNAEHSANRAKIVVLILGCFKGREGHQGHEGQFNDDR